MAKEPASIRYNNPGAMWGGSALAKKWGATKTVPLNDGLGQGNNIAFFPTKVRGAAAQFDLWHTSPKYHNQKLYPAIHTWSGGNWTDSYVNFLTKRVPGLSPSTKIDDDFLQSGSGVAFVKAQAWHEAGKPYPMSDAEWRAAQELVFHPAANPKPLPPVATHGGPVATGTATTTTALQSGFNWPLALALGVATAVAVFFVVRFVKNYRDIKALDAAIAKATDAIGTKQV